MILPFILVPAEPALMLGLAAVSVGWTPPSSWSAFCRILRSY